VDRYCSRSFVILVLPNWVRVMPSIRPFPSCPPRHPRDEGFVVAAVHQRRFISRRRLAATLVQLRLARGIPPSDEKHSACQRFS